MTAAFEPPDLPGSTVARADAAARYDFDQGLPDPDLYPIVALRRAFDAVLADDGRQACRYFSGAAAADMSFGHHGLREAIAEWLRVGEACEVAANGVLLANGSTNGIAMAINHLAGPGDAVIVEEVSYPYAAKYARAAGATVLTVPIGPEGMEVDELEATFAAARSQGLRPRLVYTIATFQSPTGTVLDTDRRTRLIECCRASEVMILDDNCYYHLWFDEPPPPSLLTLDGGSTVIQSGSFSKYLAPALRMAWLAGSPEHIAGIAAARQDFAVSQILARVVERLIRSGELDAHLAALRSAYRTKRDLAAAVLADRCGDLVTFAVPRGGLYFWLEIDGRVDVESAMQRAASSGVGFRPGVRFLHRDDGRHFLRLSVAQSPLGDIEPGISLLGRALRESLR